MLMQLPNIQPGQLENWLLPAVAVLSIAALIKKVFPRKRSDDELVSKTELHHELNTVRDKIDARFLTLSEKIEHLGSSIHEKLTSVESSLARVDSLWTQTQTPKFHQPRSSFTRQIAATAKSLACQRLSGTKSTS